MRPTAAWYPTGLKPRESRKRPKRLIQAGPIPYIARLSAGPVPAPSLEFQPVMYAVIATGGKQYRVAEGDVVRIEKLTAEPGGDRRVRQGAPGRQGSDVKIGAPFARGRQGHRGTVQKHGKGDKKVDRQVPSPQALPAAGHAPPALHRRQDHGHRRRLSRRANTETCAMAHKKAGGSTKNGRDSESKRLGLKKFGGAAGPGRQHPRPSARHALSRRRQRRHRHGPHAVRADGRHACSSSARASPSAYVT